MAAVSLKCDNLKMKGRDLLAAGLSRLKVSLGGRPYSLHFYRVSALSLLPLVVSVFLSELAL